MTPYQEALRRYRQALSDSQAAPRDRDAAGRLAAAASVMERYAIDPEYRENRERVPA